ncbi:hypothetical protein [Roseibium sp.]|uniref:hypothetical protein n=1 Tax=Roseibium sp. TaxID=1936156 RepID=UPI003B50BBBB
MSATYNASDWEVSGYMDGGVGAGIAGGYWTFIFRSRAANYAGLYGFAGGGLGFGGRGGSVSLPEFGGEAAHYSYTRIDCNRIFSANDLDGCYGRLTTAGAGAGAGYGLCSISAVNMGGSLFSSQDVNGPGFTAGASAMTTMGIWARITVLSFSMT